MASSLEPPTAPLQSFGQSELSEACRNGNLNQVKDLISILKRNGATLGEFGAALHESSARGHFQIAEFLLKEGADVNALDRDGRTPLQCTVSEGKDYVASLLICHGADFNNVSTASQLSFQSKFDALRSHSTPLMVASAKRDCSFVRDRISSGSDVSKEDHYHRTALFYACRSKSTEAVELLLNAGAHVDVQDSNQYTPLMLAVQNYIFDIMRLLLQYDSLHSAVNRTDLTGQTALHYACEGSSTEAVELLLNAGAHVDVQDSDHNTPLMLAVKNGTGFDIMRLLLKNDSLRSGVNRADLTNKAALHYACEGHSSSTEAVKLLLNAGAHVDVQDRNRFTPLMMASKRGNNINEVVKQLILYGADVNKTSWMLNTALHFAARHNHIECGILLVEAGANGHLKDRYGQSALALAKPAFKDAVTQAISFQTKKAICVVGNALSGKSTLVASLKNEEANVLQKARNYLFGVGGISQRTTGIEPVPLSSKRFGSVMFFDFAGQQEYHGLHELFLKSILSRGLSTVTVIVVVKATEEGSAITHQLNRWLYPLSQASLLASNQVRIIVVASHMDKVKKTTNAKMKLESAYEDIKQAFVGAPLQFVNLVCLDCRQPYSDGINKLCEHLNDVPFPKYKTEDAGYSIPWIISRIRVTIDDKVLAVADLSAWSTKYRNDLPSNLPDADIVCRDLSSTGHFLYLPNSQDLAKGWLVLDLPYVLHEVYGTIFSPFGERRIADQFGLVTVTTLADLFPTWNPDLICGILIALQFAIKVDSTMWELTALSSGHEEGDGVKIYPQHLFFPALVSSQRTTFFKESSFTLMWYFRVNCQSYITPFLLQAIIHNLTTKHILFHEQGSLRSKHLCRVWYNGIFWQSPNMDTAVQVSDSSVLQVIAAATNDTSAEELFKYTAAVIGDISSTIHNLAPRTSGSSYIICPGEPQALLENPQAPSPLHMFPVDFILDSLKKNKTACLSRMDRARNCPATRMAIPSLFCGFEPTMEDIFGLMLQPIANVKRSAGSVESETVDTLPDTSIVKLETTPIAGRDTTQQLLDKYKDNFISDLNSHSIRLHIKVDNIIPSSVCFEVERVCYEEGNLILFHHLREQGDLEALQRFCKVVIQVGKEGYPKMHRMGQNIQRDLEQFCLLRQ